MLPGAGPAPGDRAPDHACRDARSRLLREYHRLMRIPPVIEILKLPLHPLEVIAAWRRDRPMLVLSSRGGGTPPPLPAAPGQAS